MEIKLQGIGIINDSTIKIDGLTVITGRNNSGKTTVGKALYSIIDAVSNINKKFKLDKHAYLLKQLSTVRDYLEIFQVIHIVTKDTPLTFFSNYPALDALSSVTEFDFHHDFLTSSSEEFIHLLLNELSSFDFSLLEKLDSLDAKTKMIFSKSHNVDSFISDIQEQFKKSIMLLMQTLAILNDDHEIINYTRESINQTLQLEFFNQIQPVKVSVKSSSLELTDDNSILFKFKIIDNKIINDGTPVFISSPYKKIYLIDNPFILDDVPYRRKPRPFIPSVENPVSLFNPGRIRTHEEKLKATLRYNSETSVFEQTVLDGFLDHVKKKIDQILPGTFEFASNGEFYVQNGAKLRISNLATGSKLFSIIKLLLEKGELDDSTMLILDEPEAHLHPEWQNAFAEIIALLVSELRVNVILTTHSPNFMLAIDAFMRKYKIERVSNFYQTKSTVNGLVDYKCVNNDLGDIYQDFLAYLSEVKMLRNLYLHGGDLES